MDYFALFICGICGKYGNGNADFCDLCDLWNFDKYWWWIKNHNTKCGIGHKFMYLVFNDNNNNNNTIHKIQNIKCKFGHLQLLTPILLILTTIIM